MTWTDEMAEALCLLIGGFDQRFELGELTTKSWKLAANSGGWEFPAAVAAAQRFYTRPLSQDEMLPRIAPGHLEMLMRQARPGGTGPAPVSEVRGLPAGPRASAEHRARLRAELAGRLEARGVVSRVRARRPAWDPEDVRADDVVDESVVDLEGARRRLRLATQRGRGGGASAAFGGSFG